MKHVSQPGMKNGPNISHNPTKIVQTEDQNQANPVLVDIGYHPTRKASAGKEKHKGTNNQKIGNTQCTDQSDTWYHSAYHTITKHHPSNKTLMEAPCPITFILSHVPTFNYDKPNIQFDIRIKVISNDTWLRFWRFWQNVNAFGFFFFLVWCFCLDSLWLYQNCNWLHCTSHIYQQFPTISKITTKW